MSPRTPEKNKAIRKNTAKKIREAALELFARRGYHHTSISAIAKKAGVSKGLMYNYYESKEALLRAIVEALQEDANGIMQQLDQAENVREKIVVSINLAFEFIETQPEFSRMLIALAVQPEATRVMADLAGKFIWDTIRLYAELLKDTSLKDIEREIYIFAAALDGLAMHYLVFKEDKDYPWDAIKSRFIEVTLKQLKL